MTKMMARCPRCGFESEWLTLRNTTDKDLIIPADCAWLPTVVPVTLRLLGEEDEVVDLSDFQTVHVHISSGKEKEENGSS